MSERRARRAAPEVQREAAPVRRLAPLGFAFAVTEPSGRVSIRGTWEEPTAAEEAARPLLPHLPEGARAYLVRIVPVSEIQPEEGLQ